jgi:hypothetical protein
MDLPKAPQPPPPPTSPFPKTLEVKPPDPLGEYKKSFGLLGTPFGMWGKMNTRGRRGP